MSFEGHGGVGADNEVRCYGVHDVGAVVMGDRSERRPVRALDNVEFGEGCLNLDDVHKACGVALVLFMMFVDNGSPLNGKDKMNRLHEPMIGNKEIYVARLPSSGPPQYMVQGGRARDDRTSCSHH